MPNYIPSNWVTAQAKLLENFNSPEKRFNDPNVFKLYASNPEVMFPSHKTIRTREDRVVETYYKLRTARALGTGGRAANHTGVKGDSGVLTPSWTTYDDKFAISIKQADNNIYSFQEMMDNELENVIANFADGLNAAATQHLFDNRTTVNAANGIEGAFNVVNNVFDITNSTNGDRAVQITESTMHINEYGLGLTLVCDTIAFNKFKFQANQGTANNQNLSFQFAGMNFEHSTDMNALAAGLGYTEGFWIALNPDTVSSLDWIPRQNREGYSSVEQEYGQIMNPVDGLMYATHTYRERVDDAAANGFDQDELIEHEVSIDIALENAPLSVAGESTLFAFGLI